MERKNLDRAIERILSIFDLTKNELDEVITEIFRAKGSYREIEVTSILIERFRDKPNMLFAAGYVLAVLEMLIKEERYE